MPVSSQDKTAVTVVIERYIEGYVNANEQLLREAFATDAVMNGYVGERLVVGSPEPFIQRVISEPSLKAQGLDPEYNIEQCSITGGAAAVVLKEYGFGAHNFIDYMHLLKRDGVWKIVSKTFSTFNLSNNE